ncbi:hypothetical protein JW930_02100 [Candidatus Woesearchaeota archaeon]|nr:hypothetical protein [Candidatus Woesearchaeota archaeon]
MDLAVINKEGDSIFHDISRVSVNTLLWREYTSLEELPEGTYTIVLDAVYNSTVTERFEKKVDIRSEKGFLTRPILGKYPLLNWINIIGAGIVLAVTFSYLYFIKNPYKKKFMEKRK